MNYEENKKEWKNGDIVIHDADHKDASMLMRVLDADDQNKIVTAYVYQAHGKGEYTNSFEDLHDPIRFGIVTSPQLENIHEPSAKIKPVGRLQAVVPKNDFDSILDRRLDLIRSTLATKAIEYATDADRYHNFSKASNILKCSPESAAWSFATKHLVSIMDIVEATDRGEDIDIEQAEEKIGDMINYLILIEGLLKR